uniref:Ovule protein n=1 Tax=Schistosoma curassoni TaxID=6186 RepID=A0A183L287_9TREM
MVLLVLFKPFIQYRSQILTKRFSTLLTCENVIFTLTYQNSGIISFFKLIISLINDRQLLQIYQFPLETPSRNI